MFLIKKSPRILLRWLVRNWQVNYAVELDWTESFQQYSGAKMGRGSTLQQAVCGVKLGSQLALTCVLRSPTSGQQLARTLTPGINMYPEKSNKWLAVSIYAHTWHWHAFTDASGDVPALHAVKHTATNVLFYSSKESGRIKHEERLTTKTRKKRGGWLTRCLVLHVQKRMWTQVSQSSWHVSGVIRSETILEIVHTSP